MYPQDICRVDSNYADPEFDSLPMPTVEDDYEDDFTWDDYDNAE